MAGFVDVVLRGLILVLTSVALGGVVWLRFVVGAVARVEWRAPLVALDALHQLAAALWVGGLAHLTLYAIADGRSGESVPPSVHAGLVAPATTIRRFSTLAFWSMAVIVLAGVALSVAYVDD